MKIEYVCHSCLYIETSDAKIALDPWFKGTTYNDQWHLFPKPVNTERLQQVDHICISHGHQDHLNKASLEALPKTAKIFYPYQWKGGITQLMDHIGFQDITEAISYKKYQIAPNTAITYIANSLDSMVVIEDRDEVLVNLNDSLNSHHKSIIHLFTKEIKKRWPKIDYLFCGLGGAGYFPNTVHYENKNDWDIGVAREQFLAFNFCKLVQALQAKIVLPFTPGFALLEDDKQWINKIKFPRELIGNYYQENFDPNTQTQFISLYPGDQLSANQHEKLSPYHDQIIDNSLSHLIETTYAQEIAEKNQVHLQDPKLADQILQKIKENLPKAASYFVKEILEPIQFSIELKDFEQATWFYIAYDATTEEWTCNKESQLNPKSKVSIHTLSHHLLYSLEGEWGGDVFFIGYAHDVYIHDPIALELNLDVSCLRLLTQYPTAMKNLKKEPLRGMKFLMTNPLISKLLIKNKIATKGNPNKLPFNERSHWINKSKCEICQICDFPLLSHEFGEQIS